MSDLTDRIAEVLHGELDEHGCEDDDEKRWQVAQHWAQRVAEALRPDRHTVAMAIRDAAGGSYTWEVLAQAAIEACGWPVPHGCKRGCKSAAEHRAHGGTPQSRFIGGMP